jgi:DNA-binding MarR family transcriptional regulator
MSRVAHSKRSQQAVPRAVQSTLRNSMALSRRFYQIATAVLAEVHDRERTGLRHLEFGLMVHMHDTPGMDQNSLAERMVLDRTTISTLVFRLEQQGLIERAVNGEDRRARVLRLTPAGVKLHDRIRVKTEEAQQRILAVLAPSERRAFVDMLMRVIDANQAYVGPGAGRRVPRSRKEQDT